MLSMLMNTAGVKEVDLAGVDDPTAKKNMLEALLCAVGQKGPFPDSQRAWTSFFCGGDTKFGFSGTEFTCDHHSTA